MTIPVNGRIIDPYEFDIEAAVILQDTKPLFLPSSPPDYPILKRRAYRTQWGRPGPESESDDDDKEQEELERRASNIKHGHLVRLNQPLDAEIPEYPDDIPVFGPFEKGNFFDVISMLSNNGRDYLVRNNGDRVLVESLRGKYILICCFFVPIHVHSYAAEVCLDMLYTYSELSLEKPDQFEMVMVAKMRPYWAHDQPAFDHFFSAFPCLAIPFSDSHSRELICKSLGLDHCIDWQPTVTLIVDPEQTVLNHNFDHTSFIHVHGASSFPFTDERLHQLETEVHELRLRIDEKGNAPPSLAELLCLNPSDYLRKCDDSDELVSVLELNKKLVGLYLCDGGDFLTTLNYFHKKCIAEGLEFEIVLVYLPFKGEIKWFQNRVNAALLRYRISSWWVLPFKDTVSRRLSELCGNYWDKLIIVGPNSTFGDTLGIPVMAEFGAKAYPFTRQGIIDRKLAKLRALSLESVLMECEEHNYVVNKDGDRVPMANLLGRNIILYLDYLSKGIRDNELHDELIEWYPKLKAKDPDFEVVFVPFDEDTSGSGGEIDEWLSGMPWLAFPLPSGHSRRVVDQLFLEWEEGDEYHTLMAFGKDGRIRSRYAQHYLTQNGVDAFPFNDHLCRELAAPLSWLSSNY